MVWDEIFDPEKGRSLDDESVLFALHFTLIGNDGESGVIRLSDDPTPFKLVPSSGEDIDETTRWAEITLNNEFTVSGNVTMVGDESSLPVSGVTVTLNQDGSDNDILTDASGDYSFTLTSGSGIKLSANLAHGEGKANQGVDVADIVEMRKHILSRVRFENARKMVAADTNRDASVDVADIVAMRKVILARTDYFSEDGDGNKEPFWRFVDVDFVGLSADVAFNQVESFEKIGFGSLSGDLSELDFAAIKLGDVNGDWTDPNWATLSGRASTGIGGLIRLSAPEETGDRSLSIDLYADEIEGFLGMQFGLNWDRRVLQLAGIETHQLPGFSQQAHSHLKEGSAQVAWDNDFLSHVNLVGNKPVMTLHFDLQPGADRGTSIQLTQPVLVGSQGSDRAVMGVASYYHPEGGTMLSSQGLIRSMHRSEGNLSLEFATQEGTSYVVESTEALATGQWKAITTVEGSGRHEVIEMPTTEQAQSYLRVREVSGIVE
jgi:hypothetical protein